MTRRRGWSDITVTDQFCGAGGSSIGAAKAGLRVRMAMNHWKLAVETHNTNFPETDHDCCDISASDPRRYPSTDILITSPECTTHSPAGGNRRRSSHQSDLFTPAVNDPTVERSRATMWDVPRFAEYHKYRRIVVENVVEVLRWELFDVWLSAMHTLGYRHKIVSLNSMFCWPTPQSRDRVYINFWHKGDKAPDLDLRPKAPCAKCGVVEAVQTWKNGRTVGKYRFQYLYTCPTCRAAVTPFYYAALNAIDFSVAAERIGDRARPLKERTLERIRFGLEKYGKRPLIVRTNMTSGIETRVRGLDEPHLTQTASWLDAYVAPFVVACANTGSDGPARVRGLDESLTTVHAGGNNHALVGGQPFLVKIRGTDESHLERSASGLGEAMPTMVANSLGAALVSPFIVNGHMSRRVHGVDQPLSTQSASREHDSIVVPLAFISVLRTHNRPGALDDPLATICTGGGHHLIVQGAAQISLRDANAMRVAGLERELMTQGCAPQQGIVSRSPFIVSHYGTNNASPLDAPVPSVTTIDRHELVEPGAELRVEDCYFRMLQPHEIGAAMAFPETYEVLGNKRDRVKQYGNAVTPPAMETLIERAVGAMTGDRVA
jgi:DNA (cytosine-5)-methyltransferase 1